MAKNWFLISLVVNLFMDKWRHVGPSGVLTGNCRPKQTDQPTQTTGISNRIPSRRQGACTSTQPIPIYPSSSGSAHSTHTRRHDFEALAHDRESSLSPPPIIWYPHPATHSPSPCQVLESWRWPTTRSLNRRHVRSWLLHGFLPPHRRWKTSLPHAAPPPSSSCFLHLHVPEAQRQSSR